MTTPLQNLSINVGQGNIQGLNPKTGLTDQQVLSESNAVAERAAAMLGGTWEQGRMEGGKVAGGFTPGITSSSSVQEEKNKNQALVEAGNKLTSSPGGTDQYMNQYNQLMSQQVGNLQSGYNDMMQVMQLQQQALDMTFDANMGKMNAQYAGLFNELKQNHEKAVQVAEYNAQALNPYSRAAGAQTAANFTGEVTRKYQQQAISLQQQADAAMQSLQAGQFEAYVAMQQNMVTAQNQFRQQMLGFMMDNVKEIEDARRFDVQEQRANVNQYVDFLSEKLPTPQELSQMTDEQLATLPVVQQGLRSGYDLAGIREDLMNASNMQAQDMAWDMEDREADKEYRQAQIDNIYDQIRSRRLGDSKAEGGDEPISWNEFLNMRQEQEGQTFTMERIEQERSVFHALYREKGMPTYDQESLPGTVRSDILGDIKFASDNGQELTLQQLSAAYPEASQETLEALMGEYYEEPNLTDPDTWAVINWFKGD